ncbi:MAG TPA: DNA/RNA non-specific endonuclease, partial [Clostridiales bacterium]|nr:DNA/RNA non-specific endonuclease [Clostridiales bacterium]
MFFVGAIAALPIKPIKNIWGKIPVKAKWFKAIVLALVFFLAIGTTPASVWEDNNNDSSIVETEETEISDKGSTHDVEESISTEPEETKNPEVTEDPEELVELEKPDETEGLEEETGITSETTQEVTKTEDVTENTDSVAQFDLSVIPVYTGKAYAAVNDNNPFFTDAELLSASTSYESYANLDELGRCGVSIASVGQDIMPTEKRGSIGSVKPSGWQTVKYNGVVNGNYLYNRSHLIGFQLTGENANTKNLITGTRYMNVDGMLPFENMVADYVKETNNHVLYRVTPIFEGSNLVASGVLIEAKSVEDSGDGILFNVYVYNVQPGVIIDYKTGNSELDETIAVQEPTTKPTPAEEEKAPTNEIRYVLNTNTKKFHYPTCSSVKTIKDSNMKEFKGDREDLIS